MKTDEWRFIKTAYELNHIMKIDLLLNTLSLQVNIKMYSSQTISQEINLYFLCVFLHHFILTTVFFPFKYTNFNKVND
jgi:hypothetical protein